MRASRLHFVLALIALAICVITVGLYTQLTSYDPYSWAFPGIESDASRSLWLGRRALYLKAGMTSFIVAVLLAVAASLQRRKSHRAAALPAQASEGAHNGQELAACDWH